MAIVYRHIRLDKNEVFYIGIGIDENRPYNKATRNGYWKNIVNKTKYRVDILFNDLTWEEACEKEKEFIKLYGRKDLGLGTLVNMTDGGEGSIGYKHNDETKKLLSESHKGEKSYNYGRKLTDETRKKISDSKKGKIPKNIDLITNKTDEMKCRFSEKMKGRKHTDETKKMISEATKKQIKEKGHPMKGKKLSNETRKKMSEAAKKREEAKRQQKIK